MAKTDINMIPKKKKLPASISVGIPFAIILIVLIIAAGIYLPNSYLDMKKQDLKTLMTQLDSYGEVTAEYNLATSQVGMLSGELETLDVFLDTGKDIFELIQIIQTATPRNVTILNMDFGIDTIEISAIANRDLDIAGFEDALWETTLFSEIGLVNITGPQEERAFLLSLKYSQDINQGGNGNE